MKPSAEFESADEVAVSAALEEVLGGHEPPDLTKEIEMGLQRATKLGRIRKFVIGATAACVMIGCAMIVFGFGESTPDIVDQDFLASRGMRVVKEAWEATLKQQGLEFGVSKQQASKILQRVIIRGHGMGDSGHGNGNSNSWQQVTSLDDEWAIYMEFRGGKLETYDVFYQVHDFEELGISYKSMNFMRDDFEEVFAKDKAELGEAEWQKMLDDRKYFTALPGYLRKVNQSPTLDDDQTFNPLLLVRAVNALQALGKKRALNVLQEYVTKTREYERKLVSAEYLLREGINVWAPPYAETFEARMESDDMRYKLTDYGLDEGRILAILRLLFVRGDELSELETLRAILPAYRYNGSVVNRPRTLDPWPLFPWVVRNDCPFVVGLAGLVLDKSTDVDTYLTFCGRNYVKFREAPLVPSLCPTDVADLILNSEEFKSDPDFEAYNCKAKMRYQALLALRPHYIVVGGGEDLADDAIWQKHKDAVDKLNFRWDTEQQAFVPGVVVE